MIMIKMNHNNKKLDCKMYCTPTVNKHLYQCKRTMRDKVFYVSIPFFSLLVLCRHLHLSGTTRFLFCFLKFPPPSGGFLHFFTRPAVAACVLLPSLP